MIETQERQAGRLAEALVSDRCGLITDLSPQSRGPDEPCPPHLWTATLSNYDFRNAPRGDRLNAGKGRTEAEAKLSAMGEAIERYSAYHWDPARVRVGPAAPQAILPTDCVLYSPSQYETGLPYATWNPETETSWITGVELPSGDPVELPAALAYLVSPTPRREDQFTAITSNGLAAGADLTGAIIGGLYEVIERDALMITWLNRLPAIEIQVTDGHGYTPTIIRHYARFGALVRILWLASDQIPYVMMAVLDNPPGTGATRLIGMGCDINPVAAVDKAVFELCQARPSMAARLQSGDPTDRLHSYEDVVDLDDHPLFHAIPKNASEFDFLFASKRRHKLDALPTGQTVAPDDVLLQIVAGAESAGARVAYVDLTSEDIRPLGPRAVRVFITDFQPIHFGFGEGRFGGHRLFDAPVHWGLRDKPLSEDELNPCPHPLA